MSSVNVGVEAVAPPARAVCSGRPRARPTGSAFPVHTELCPWHLPVPRSPGSPRLGGPSPWRLLRPVDRWT